MNRKPGHEASTSVRSLGWTSPVNLHRCRPVQSLSKLRLLQALQEGGRDMRGVRAEEAEASQVIRTTSANGARRASPTAGTCSRY